MFPLTLYLIFTKICSINLQILLELYLVANIDSISSYILNFTQDQIEYNKLESELSIELSRLQISMIILSS